MEINVNEQGMVLYNGRTGDENIAVMKAEQAKQIEAS